jgi:glycosyltransferase involved in cell wall biosynthesis
MKVLMIARSTLFTDKGGDTVQVKQTATWLNNLGIETTIMLSNESIDYKPYDLLHFFNITRPADILLHIKASRKPYVISPIFVDYTEYDRSIRKGFAGLLFRILPAGMLEYVKVMARALAGNEKIVSKEYLLRGHQHSVRKILKNAWLILPNSTNEYQRLVAAYGIEKKYVVIPNAVDEIFLENAPGIEKRDPWLVICVGRIEGRKNQLNLIKAMNSTAYKLLLIGNASTNQKGYYHLCRSIAKANIEFISFMSQKELITWYRKAAVHILPSWFETTGLSSLEAAAMGCNIVITDKGDTREYFGDDAVYCDPASPASILDAIQKAASKDISPLQRKISEQYTWKETARKTADAYRSIVQSATN